MLFTGKGRDKNWHTFELRAYLYQAKDLFRGDNSGLSDPYAVVIFDNYSEQSITLKKTVSPVWNQTLLVPDVKLYGNMDFIMKYCRTKCVTVQIWDRDFVSCSYVAITMCYKYNRCAFSPSSYTAQFNIHTSN